MRAKILHGERQIDLAQAVVEGDGLWLLPGDLERAAGWEYTLEGLCRGPMCVPVPPGERGREIVRGAGPDTRINLVALARHMGQPVAASPRHGVWVIGEAAQDAAERLRSLEAPDFTLPDLDGRLWSLSSFRGRKVFLLAWASW